MGMKPRRPPVLVVREFWLATKSGERRIVRLTLDDPQPDRGDYRCSFSIVGLEEREVIKKRAYGVDGVQALQLAMQVAMIDLVFATTAFREGRLTFLGSPDLGLPVVDPIREHVKAEKWVRVSLEPGTTASHAKLAETFRKHLITYPEDELLDVLEAVAEDGHEHFSFASNEAAASFRDDVLAQGVACELKAPPPPFSDAVG